MNHHFAASWLQSLSGKLESLAEWNWAVDKKAHRNLFREFFSAPFQKTLALVDEKKKTEFLMNIEKHLYKFEERSQQFPLGCLCALLQYGKDSPKTQDKVVAWVDFLLDRMSKDSINIVIEECLTPPFLKFSALVNEADRDRLADGLGEHVGRLPEELQKRVFDDMPLVAERIDKLVGICTKELNAWLESAPRYPATPAALVDALAGVESPLVRFFTTVKDTTRKESFLVAVALSLQGLRTRFRWMCCVEPDLESMGAELQRRLFFVEGQGPVMEMWLQSRLKKYNVEVVTRVNSVMVTDPPKGQMLRTTLQSVFPARNEADPQSCWLTLDGPTALADALVKWLTSNCPGFFCPQHTLGRETLMAVLQRFGPCFEVEPGGIRVRLGATVPEPPREVPLPIVAKPVFPPSPPATSSTQLVPYNAAPALPAQGASHSIALMPLPQTMPAPASTSLALAVPKSEATNLIDLLIAEEIESLSPDMRARVVKVSHGVYRIGAKEVTLHTQNGRLFVYRVGETVRQLPLAAVFQEEGLVAPQQVAVGGAVDNSAVARIAMQSAAISAGVTTTTAASHPTATLPFGLSRPEPRTDPQALMSKRVEAATRAMDVSKQIVRRTINFEDEKFLKKLLAKGLKHDRTWQTAYEEYCTSRGVADLDFKKQDKDFVATFIERNLANSINQEWAKKMMYSDQSAGDGKKEKKEKKDKQYKKEKHKKKKDKKRKASDSSSSDEERPDAGPDPNANLQLAIRNEPAPLSSPPLHMEMPMHMPMYGMGLHPGMMGPAGISLFGNMMGDTAIPGFYGEQGDDHRARKKAKADRTDKTKKCKKDR